MVGRGGAQVRSLNNWTSNELEEENLSFRSPTLNRNLTLLVKVLNILFLVGQ